MRVDFHSMLRHYGNLDLFETEKNLTISGLLESLKIDQGEIGVILINGALSSFDAPIENKDKIDFYPIFGGG